MLRGCNRKQTKKNSNCDGRRESSRGNALTRNDAEYARRLLKEQTLAQIGARTPLPLETPAATGIPGASTRDPLKQLSAAAGPANNGDRCEFPKNWNFFREVATVSRNPRVPREVIDRLAV